MTNLFLSFLEVSIPVSFLIVLLLLLTPFFDKRYAARWKYWIWIVLALRLLIPIGANGGTPSAGLRPQRELPVSSESESEPGPGIGSETGSEKTALEAPALPESGQTVQDPPAGGTAHGRVIVEIPAQMTAPIAVRPEKAGNRISPLDLIVCVWVFGSAVTLAVPLASYLFFQRRLRKKGSIVRDETVLRALQKLKRELQIRRAVSVIEYPDASSPMLTGFSAPVLVLPKAHCNEEELFFIVKHELIHLKRGDLYCKLLFEAVRAVHWFNPLVWVMQKEAAVDMELSCDEQVMKDSGYAQRKAYTEVLFSMLHQQSAGKITLSTNFYGGKRIMKKRFQNILSKTEKKNGAAVLVCAVILAMSLGTLVGCSITPESPEAVSAPAAVPAPSDAGNMQAENMQSDSPLQGASDAAPIAAPFVPGMGCSDAACTDPAHHHDCPAGCADYEHHHTCALDCTDAGHHHGAAAANDSVNFSISGHSDHSVDLNVSGNPDYSVSFSGSGTTSSHHSNSGHHSDSHH